MTNRYDKDYMHGEVRFHLSDYMPNEEQCRLLMLKVLEQTVRDYCSLAKTELANERQIWEEARAFLMDKNYRFQWGEYELALESFLDILNLNTDWVRAQAQKKFIARNS